MLYVSGEFIKMILQIPVEGGHEGGRIKVEHLDQMRVFNVSENSDKCCHLTAFYADCDHQLEEVTFGWRLAMVFSLELETPKVPNISPQLPNLQTFLDVNNVRNILTKWNQLEEGPQFFALHLEHRYSTSELNFRGLKGNDRLLYQLLQSIDIVDFRLAQIQKYERGTVSIDEEEESDFEEDDCTCCAAKNCKCVVSRLDQLTLDEVLEEEVKIVKFVGVSGDVLKSPGLIIDVDGDVIQFDRQLFTKPEKKRMDYTVDLDDPGPFLSCWYDSAVLVLWPKSKALDVALSYNFTAELTRLEANPDVEILGKVIEFCREQPERVWTETADREDRTRRLIQLCLVLKSASEGLRLLERMSCEFTSKMEDDLFMDYEGIQSKEIAMGIAKLVALIGWSDCMYVIEKFTKVDRALDQIENYAHLTIALLDLGLVDIGKQFGNRVCSLLFSRVHRLMSRLPSCSLVASFSMILRMYEMEGFTTIRLTSFIESLKSLSFTQLFTVIADTDKAFSEVSKKSYVCQNLQRSLQRHLTTCFIPDDLADNVMIFFIQLDDPILLKEFTNHIVKQEDSLAVSKILASPDVWNVALLSLGGRWALQILVDDRILHLQRMSVPLFSWFQHCDLSVDVQLATFLRSTSFRETFNGFENERAATEWMRKFFGRNQIKRGYSAVAVVEEGVDGEIGCVVTKTPYYFRYKTDKFIKSREELIALRDRRDRRLKNDSIFEIMQSPSKRIRLA